MKIIIFILIFISESLSAHVIIVHKKRNIVNLSTVQVREIFLGENLRWEDNSAIHIVDYNSDYPLRKKFSEEIIGVSINRVYKTWVKLSLAGNSTPPKILRSEEEVIDSVSADISAIGYLANGANINLKEVKVITIEN